MNENLTRIADFLGYPGVRSGVGNLIWKFEESDMMSKMEGVSEAETIRIGINHGMGEE